MPAGILLGRLALALALSSAIGLEREIHRKSAGLRTVTIVGIGAAVAMLVSKYGFADMTAKPVSFDPSRVAAQIVSGIGFLGAGLIFVHRDSVSGLTTAAIVWLTAMIGMACGAGLFLLAVGATAAHFIVTVGFAEVIKRSPRLPFSPTKIDIVYTDRHGVLRDVLRVLTDGGWSVSDIDLDRAQGEDGTVAVTLTVTGKAAVSDITSELSDLEGVLSVSSKPVALDV
ncbi:MAG TPA: MgtC/SapB family protein [Acidimicrobiia bacterium]|jgi:putative Mg2+ transporter-C (MgtC) family protein|nr:MgtC/SapB family protein [Acidimicrobiia bacterium]